MNTKILNECPLVTVFEDFLDADTCKKFIEYPWAWEKSTGYDHAEHRAKPTSHRTSSTTFIYENHKFDDFVAYTKAKISRTLKVRSQRFEFLQMQKYSSGEQYKHHHDYFFQGPEALNNRLGTVIIYLNDNFSGGETKFHKLGFSVTPKLGRALYFQYNYSPDENLLTEHSGEPIIEGEKFIVTAWFRKDNWGLDNK